MADQVAAGLLSPLLRRSRIGMARPYLVGRVLDIGCGVGALSRYCSRDGYIGVDPDEESVALARRSNPGFRFEREIPAEGNFDTIVGLAVIEHICDPGAWITSLGLRLTDCGKLLLTTPHPSFEWVHTWGSRLGVFSAEAADEHERLIDRAAMAILAREAGLEVTIYRRFLMGANQLFVLSPLSAA
ncbi:MAG: class I SAM-dependent methyltransferase [Rhodospirillales bacterium]|nr:class I SAM-dependent methyltransferase [Rhodospirillales bacterium]